MTEHVDEPCDNPTCASGCGRAGSMNCLDADPDLNVQHFIVANTGDGGLAACGFVLQGGHSIKAHEDRTGEPCRCAPAETWPRCAACGTALAESAARKAERAAAGRKEAL